MHQHTLLLAAATLLACAGLATGAQPASGGDADKVVVSGTVPDEASRAAILGRVRDLYGAAAVLDRLEVGGVVPPPKWTEHMTRLIGPGLKNVQQGRLHVEGTQVALEGTVANEALRQQVPSDMATALNPTYTVDNGLVVRASAQTVLNETLSDRVVEFESGSDTLTHEGVAILDEMAEAIARLGHPRVQIVGHTDSSGERLYNIGLSLSRAHAVRRYLVDKGIPADSLSAVGAGPDRPLTSNDSAEGRAKNRRIEFRLLG